MNEKEVLLSMINDKARDTYKGYREAYNNLVSFNLSKSLLKLFVEELQLNRDELCLELQSIIDEDLNKSTDDELIERANEMVGSIFQTDKYNGREASDFVFALLSRADPKLAAKYEAS